MGCIVSDLHNTIDLFPEIEKPVDFVEKNEINNKWCLEPIKKHLTCSNSFQHQQLVSRLDLANL